MYSLYYHHISLMKVHKTGHTITLCNKQTGSITLHLFTTFQRRYSQTYHNLNHTILHPFIHNISPQTVSARYQVNNEKRGATALYTSVHKFNQHNCDIIFNSLFWIGKAMKQHLHIIVNLIHLNNSNISS